MPHVLPSLRRAALAPALLVTTVAAFAASPATAAAEKDDPWPDIKAMLFEDRVIHDGAGVVGLEAPYRAHDAAVVPITVTAEMPQRDDRYIKSIYLVIDENPAPLAGVFHLGPDNGDATISTRVRVNEYTDVRAIAEANDGELYMASAFVKAAGGCSAPALKDQEKAMTRLGKMKLKQAAPLKPGEPNEVQLLISHPNYTGMQIDQLSRNWIPPHYVQDIEVSYGGETVLEVDGDISLSEDPSIHFSFVPDGPGELTAEVTDSKGQTFTRSWPLEAQRPAS